MFIKSRSLLFLLWITISNGPRNVQGININAVQFENMTYMDLLSRKAMKRMHDDLDKDDDGNVSISEGVKFFAGNKDLLKNTGENANLPGFVTDVDGRITEAEFWQSWIKSHVHNWTNGEMLSWLQYDVEMPQFANNFKALNISGAAFPILACNSSVVSALVDGSKENKLKLMLKAKEIVLFGPSKPKSNWLKDALLTFSLALTLSAIALVVHVQRTANRTVLSIQDKMKALQKSLETMEKEADLDWSRDVTRQDDERSAGSNSGDSEDSMITSYSLTDDDTAVRGKLAEVMRELDSTKEALRTAEKELQTKRQQFVLPCDLHHCLEVTYKVESNLFNMKKQQVYKNIEQTKAQFQKIERNRSTFFGVLQVVHSRQVDSFDFQVQQTRDEFRELQNIMKERRRRWAQIDQICNSKISSSSSRSSGTPSRHSSKNSPADDLLSSILDSSPTSSVSSLDDQGQGKKKVTKVKRFSVPNISDGDDTSAANSSAVKAGGKKNKTSPLVKIATPIPTYSSCPKLSLALNGHGYKNNGRKNEPAKITHSESAKHLPTHANLLPIPETGNQTFPKRSPQPKRRGKLTEVMEINQNFKIGPPTEVPTIRKSPSDTTGKISPDGVSYEEPTPLNPNKRSSSAHSLPQIQFGQINPVPDDLKEVARVITSTPALEANDESHKELLGQDEPPLTTLDTTRKQNLKKRFFNKIRKKK